MSEVVYRDAVTGEYVSEEYAKANPATTVSETDTGPATTVGVLQEEITMSNQPSQDLPKQQGSKGRDNAAAKQAEADARKDERDAGRADKQQQREEWEQAHPDQTLPEDLQ